MTDSVSMADLEKLRGQISAEASRVVLALDNLTAQVGVQNGRVAALEEKERRRRLQEAEAKGRLEGLAEHRRRDLALLGVIVGLVPTAAVIIVALIGG